MRSQDRAQLVDFDAELPEQDTNVSDVSDSEQGEPTPSATVVLLRESASARLELLLMQRAPHKGKPGPWVFPGGRVEAQDLVGSEARSDATARNAAIRETREEAGLEIADTRLETISRWITPPVSPRRFDTWFYIGVLGDHEEVTPDGEEMIGHRWIEPSAALAAYETQELSLAPPTFVTVTWLSEFANAAHAAESLAARDLITFRPRITKRENGEIVMLYPGDAGYERSDAELDGARHRCRMVDGLLRYERA